MIHVTRINLGLVYLELGDFAQAGRYFRELRRDEEVLRRIGLWGQQILGQACCEAHFGNWDVFEDLLAQALVHASPDEIVDRDLFVTAEWAGNLAADGGRTRLARQAWQLALGQARAQDREDDVQRLAERLAQDG